MATDGRKVRMLDWSLRDERSVRWDRMPGWLDVQQARGALRDASRVLVYDEAARHVREPRGGEVAELVARVSPDGASGSALVSVYRHGSETLVLLSIADGAS